MKDKATDSQEAQGQRREWNGDPACTCGCENIPDSDCQVHGQEAQEG